MKNLPGVMASLLFGLSLAVSALPGCSSSSDTPPEKSTNEKLNSHEPQERSEGVDEADKKWDYEPDVRDGQADEVKGRWRRLGSLAPAAVEERRGNLERVPHLPEMGVINSTFVPLNYPTYAQLVDVPWTDRYAPKWRPDTGELQFHPHAVYATVSTLAAHCEPKSMMNNRPCRTGHERRLHLMAGFDVRQ